MKGEETTGNEFDLTSEDLAEVVASLTAPLDYSDRIKQEARNEVITARNELRNLIPSSRGTSLRESVSANTPENKLLASQCRMALLGKAGWELEMHNEERLNFQLGLLQSVLEKGLTKADKIESAILSQTQATERHTNMIQSSNDANDRLAKRIFALNIILAVFGLLGTVAAFAQVYIAWISRQP